MQITGDCPVARQIVIWAQSLQTPGTRGHRAGLPIYLQFGIGVRRRSGTPHSWIHHRFQQAI